jgi:hypothetical protein
MGGVAQTRSASSHRHVTQSRVMSHRSGSSSQDNNKAATLQISVAMIVSLRGHTQVGNVTCIKVAKHAGHRAADRPRTPTITAQSGPTGLQQSPMPQGCNRRPQPRQRTSHSDRTGDYIVPAAMPTRWWSLLPDLKVEGTARPNCIRPLHVALLCAGNTKTSAVCATR